MKIEKGTAQIEVRGPFGSVFLYAKEGKHAIGALHRALSKKKRWDDPDYLTRIIFCELVPEDEWYETTGYGIGTEMYADVDIFISVDSMVQEILIQARGESLQDKFKMTFSKFIENFTSGAKL